MKKINPGEFKHRIEIQRAIDGKTNDDIPCKVWETLFKSKAKILNVRGQEFIQAKGFGVKLSKTFYIRARKNIEITEEDRIIYKEKEYKIHYANDIENRGIYVEIKAEVIL